MPTPKDNDLADILRWATETAPSRPGPQCQTCQHEKAAAAIRGVLELRKRGGTTVTQRQLYERVREAYPDYTARWSAMRDHILYCLGGGWNGPKKDQAD
jgi:hypothetical protein